MAGDLIDSLLTIEDSDEDFTAFERVVRKLSINKPIFRCTDGEDAIEFLHHTGKYKDTPQTPLPAMILLDLNLPGMDGRDVLLHIKQDQNLQNIPVVVFTTSSNPTDIEVCYQRGVNGYIVKPIDTSKLIWTIKLFMSYWFDVTTLPHQLD
ncbi:response regulator [Synechocystis sp. PCC 7509]|uniref:response regulator n=1 Tax=Synechocystis sp. PCC 7509 TaxID=927677 RepID=UPI0002ABEF15|nr:response regulator [Synechocystis sp. PCC 7509]